MSTKHKNLTYITTHSRQHSRTYPRAHTHRIDKLINQGDNTDEARAIEKLLAKKKELKVSGWGV